MFFIKDYYSVETLALICSLALPRALPSFWKGSKEEDQKMATINCSEMYIRILQMALHSRPSEKKVGYHAIYKTSDISYEENNQQNALIVSLINLLIFNYSNMFRPLS
jgi:hypothetical protein